MPCPVKLVFNPSQNVCDWPENVPGCEVTSVRRWKTSRPTWKKEAIFFQRNQLKFNQHNSTLPFLHKLKTEQSTVDSHLTKLSKQKQSQVHVPPFFSKTHGQQDNRHISSRQNPFFKKKSLVFNAAPIDGVVRPSLPFSSYHEHGQQMALMSAWRATKVKKGMKWWCTGNQTQTKKKGHCSGSNRDPPEKIWICHRRCDF